ncbi:MAG: nuclear transport factor 2 family protein [Bacteroidales bacterium]|nr:nuclear transport factor 2 family protein [Bacteroidales bacterium]
MKTKLVILLLLLMAACTTNKPMTDEQKAAVQEEATAAVKTYFDAMTQSDIEAMKGILENSADLTYIAAGMIYDYDRMMELAEQNLPYITGQIFDTKFEKYIIVSPECFIYTWHGKNGITMTTGDEIVLEDYMITIGFRKHVEGWKIFVGHESEKAPIPIDTTAVPIEF